MGKISNFVGKMPFAGRAVVENSAMYAYTERTSLSKKAAKCAGSAGFLACFAAAHLLQAKIGSNDIVHDYSEFANNPNMVDGAEVVVSGLYTLANAFVAYTQLEIASKVARNYMHFREKVSEGHGLATYNRSFTPELVTAKEFAFTLAGQMIFLAQRDM